MAYPISIQLYTLREQMKDGNHMAILKKVADIGYPAVEPAGMHGMTPKEFRTVVEDLGMKISSSHGEFPTPANLDLVVQNAKDLGSDYVISGVGTQDVASVDAIKATADRINQATDLLKASGLQLCLHNHWWEFERVDGQLAIERLVQLCPDAKLQIDLYWASAFGANDVAAAVAKFKAITPLVHIKDGPLVKGQPHTALGAGKMDFPPIVAAADPAVLKWLVVELDECATDMVQAVGDSYRYLVTSGLGVGKKPA